jgi:putative transposase
MELEKLNRRKAQVKLPKLGWVKFRASRSLEGETIRSATLTREGKQWFLSLLVDDGMTTPPKHASPESAVGVDRGVAVAVATSAGDLFDRMFTTPGEQRRAVRLQRKLSRVAKGSANRNKAREAFGKLRARERRRRQDFCIKTAHQLAQTNALVVLEKLPVRNMTRRCRPVADPVKPGQYLPNGGAAKSGLNRAILSKGWYRFEVALKSAARYSGTQVVKVPAAFTSQRCSACGHVDPKSRESQAVFRCTHCLRPAEHADVQCSQKHPGRRAVGGVSLWRRPVACGLWGILEAGTSRKPRGITAPAHTTGWNPADRPSGGRQSVLTGRPRQIRADQDLVVLGE